MRRNEILNVIVTSVKRHNSITNVGKMMCTIINLDLVTISIHLQNVVKFCPFVQKIQRGNKVMTEWWKDRLNDANQVKPFFFKVGEK